MDIREILKSLDENDRRLWSECRTAMRKTYLNAHNKTFGISNWQAEDDAFMDLIDIKLATLFDRSGRLVSSTSVIDPETAHTIEVGLKKCDDDIKSKLPPNAWSN